ncbi:MAG: hypothetical protein IJC25_04855 [Clostridia bacterium]|nr:hypothetical protein [Clostridia bacterium]
MKKPYRNAVRSKKLIRQAFWDLLAEHPDRPVTVADIVARADLTRNTFYAHYRDVWAVRDEFTAQLLTELETALQAADTPEKLLHTAAQFVQSHRSPLLVLQSDVLSNGLKQLLRRSLDALATPPDLPAAIVTAAVSGMVDLAMQWVREQDGLPPDGIADQLVRLLQS